MWEVRSWKGSEQLCWSTNQFQPLDLVPIRCNKNKLVPTGAEAGCFYRKMHLKSTVSCWNKSLFWVLCFGHTLLAQVWGIGLGFFFSLIPLGGSAELYLILLSFDVISFLGSIGHFHLICCSSQSWDLVNSLLLPSLDRLLTQQSQSCQSQKLL